jgi:hypothetical protein
VRLPSLGAGRGRRRRLSILLVPGIAFAFGLITILTGGETRFEPTVRPNPTLDLLGWIPATDQSRRAYAVWIDQPDAPYDLRSAVGSLSISPAPLGLGRSAEWQQTTGISSSRVTAWASSPPAGVTVLSTVVTKEEIEQHLRDAGYRRTTHRAVPLWLAPQPRNANLSIQGDNLRALNAVAVTEGRIVVGFDEASVRASLDAASGRRDSLADELIASLLAALPGLSGFMVEDQRDLAIECGAGRDWLKSDFTSASGRELAIAFRLDSDTRLPVTSAWVEYQDSDLAEVSLSLMETDWREGSIRQADLGGPISNLARLRSVSRVGVFGVADLVEGRENGWVRSGVRYLTAVCSQASRLIPAGSPVRATPVASPSPVESP